MASSINVVERPTLFLCAQVSQRTLIEVTFSVLHMPQPPKKRKKKKLTQVGLKQFLILCLSFLTLNLNRFKSIFLVRIVQ